MGITEKEIRVTIETKGETKEYGRKASAKKKPYVGFVVKGVDFLHSGAYRFNLNESKNSSNIITDTMIELNKNFIQDEDILATEINTVKAAIICVSMFMEKYRKDLVNNLADELYKKVLIQAAKQKTKKIAKAIKESKKIKKLYKLIEEYDSLVNPFANQNLKLKMPIEYFGNPRIKIDFSLNENYRAYNLVLHTKKAQTQFVDETYKKEYASDIIIQNDRKNVKLGICHMYQDGIGEFISINYSPIDKTEGIDFYIKLNTGKIIDLSNGIFNKEITEEQLIFVTNCLKRSIKKIRKCIINRMIDTTL